MGVSVGFGALAEGFAGGLAKQKADKERKAASDRADSVLAAQLDIARTNAETARISASRPIIMGGGGDAAYGNGGMGIWPGPPPGDGGAADGGPATFAGLLAEHEGAGNYDTLFGHSQKSGPFKGVRVSNMTIGEAIQFSSPNGPYGQWVKGQVGRVATPMGAGQIVGSTLRRTAKKMGLSPDTPFNADTQNRMIDYLASQRLAGQRTAAGKRAALRAEWEGYKHVPDAQLDAAILHFEETRGGVPSRGMGVKGI